MRKLIILSFILVLCVSGCAFGASSRIDPTINVVDDPSDYDYEEYDEDDNLITPVYVESIKDALDKAQGYVEEGYNQFADVTIKIREKDTTPSETVEIDSSYSDLKSITIQDGTINLPEDEGRHISVSDSSVNLTIRNVTFKGNNTGGGVSVSEGSVVFDDVTFSECVASDEDDDGLTIGGAVYVSNRGKVSFNSCEFRSNSAGNGGALYTSSRETVSFTGANTFSENSAQQDGGAIYLPSGGSIEFSGTVTLEKNSAAVNGGAIYVTGNGKITNSEGSLRFRENSTSYESGDGDDEPSGIEEGFGGAVCMSGNETLELGKATFENNAGTLGGALYISNGTLNLAATTFNKNKAYDGGAVCTVGGNLRFTDTATFTENEADDDGGAFCVLPGTREITFASKPEFNQNKANTDRGSYGDGGAIWWGISLTNFPTSGIFSGNSTNGTIDGTEIEGDAGKGGAIYLAGTSTQETLNLTSSHEFLNNMAFNKGGAIYTNSENVDIVIEGAEITTRNTAQYYNGGFLNSARGKITIRNSTISNQQANQYGGAIYGLDITIESSDFENNITVRGRGGAIYTGKDETYVEDTDEAKLTIESSVFKGNKASDRSNGAGGAITTDETEITINNTYFTENAAGQSGGAIYIGENCTDVTITQSTFTMNGFDGSGVNATYGGAIRSESTFTVTRSYFENNSAQDSGGAIYFNRQNAEFNLEYSMFRRNTSSGNTSSSNTGGGAIYLEIDRGNIESSTFDANTARGTSGIAGGAIYMSNRRESSIQNCTFTDNQASGAGANGGGLGLIGAGRVNVVSCTITANSVPTGNSAANMGGGIYVSAQGNLSIGGTIVVGNTANYGDDICALGECSSSALGFNRVGKFSGDSSTGSTSWTAQPNRGESDRSDESWTKETFYSGNVLDKNIVDPEIPPYIGAEKAGRIRLETLMLSEDVELAEIDRATNIIDLSYVASFPRLDERGADRRETQAAFDIGAVRYDDTRRSDSPVPITGYTVQSITMSGIPNSLRSLGQTTSLIAMITYTNGRKAYGGDGTGYEPVTWSSSNQNIVRIDQKGNITALATTPNNSYVTITVSTKRNSVSGSPATDSRPLRVLGQYSYLNISPEYQNFLTDYMREIAEHDIALALGGDLRASDIETSSIRNQFRTTWNATTVKQITDLTTTTPPDFTNETGYRASGYVSSKGIAPKISFNNRSNGDVFPLIYTWNFSGDEIKSILGYDLSEKTLNAAFADELFEKLRIDFNNTSRVFQVVGGTGVSASEAFKSDVLKLLRADGTKGVSIQLTAYLANVSATGTNSDGAQLVGSGSNKLLVVPDGLNDGLITGSMWMLQKSSSSDGGNNPPSTPEREESTSGSGGGGGCNTLTLGLLALAFIFRRR